MFPRQSQSLDAERFGNSSSPSCCKARRSNAVCHILPAGVQRGVNEPRLNACLRFCFNSAGWSRLSLVVVASMDLDVPALKLTHSTIARREADREVSCRRLVVGYIQLERAIPPVNICTALDAS